MKHYGDITKLSGYVLPIVDVITGGSPCQDLSVAGKRAGLAGERSGLFMEQMRIVKEMRERDVRDGRPAQYVRPRYMVWENVPGAFSSGSPKGSDFQAVLEEIVRVVCKEAPPVPIPKEGWPKAGCISGVGDSGCTFSIAWRVHDAQFWGVPQRRKRIALVADFGGLSAPEILFERKGLSGDLEPRREAGQETAGAAGEGAEGASCYGLDHVMLSGGTTYQGRGYYDNVSGCLKTQPHGVCESFSIDKAITTGGNCTAGGDCIHSEYTPALTTDRPHAVCETISFQERGDKPGGGKGILIQREHVGALSTLNNQSVLSFDPSMSRYAGTVFNDVAKTLTPGTSPGHHDAICTKEPIMLKSNQSVLAYGISSYDSNAMKSPNPHSGIYEADTARTPDLNGGSPACNQGGVAIVQGSYIPDVAHALSARYDGSPQPDKGNGANIVCVGFKHKASGMARRIGYEGEKAPSLIAGQESAVYDARGNGDGDRYVVTSSGTNVADTLDASYYKGTGSREGKERTVLCVGNGQINQVSMAEQANTLDTMHDQQAVMVAAVDYRNGTENPNINGTLQAKSTGGTGTNFNNVLRANAIVRRLTPLECERLQGYPDGWTDIGEWTDTKGKKHKPADSPRYKALGNSIALPFWAWLARRICAQYERPATLASLFDGIGGFPLVFQRSGAVPVWASEIEEFPIAVTKKHFPEE